MNKKILLGRKTQRKIRKLIKRVNIIPININNNDIYIYAKRNKRITEEQINAIKKDINNIKISGSKITKYYDLNINIYPNKTYTIKGILIRMGKGKGKIKTYYRDIIKGMICIKLILKKNNNKILMETSKNNLNSFIAKYTYFAIKK